MASFAWVTFIMLSMLIDCARLNQESEPLFGAQGKEVSFPFMSSLRRLKNCFGILYRSTAEGNLFLKNTSDPSQHSNSEQAERLVHREWEKNILLQNLSLSDSGDYMTERWRKGVLREKRMYRLTVCKDQCNDQVEYNGDGFWSVMNVSNGVTLQVYRTPRENYFQGPSHTTLVLDTSHGDQSSIKVLGNDTTVVIFDQSFRGAASYSFLIRNLGQCCTSKDDIQVAARCSTTSPSNYFRKPGQTFTSPCSDFTDKAEEVVWKTPVKDLSVEVRLSASRNVSHEEEEDMYVETSNYSLVIPSVETKHIGRYECEHDYHEGGPRQSLLFVCSDLEDAHVLFSLGGAAELVCGVELNVTTATVTFYRQLEEVEEQLSPKPEHMKVIHKKWMDGRRMFSLTMSNLTLNDSGLCLCRIWGYAEEGTPFCYDRKIFLLLKDPFGIESTFYRVYSSLMACGLLGMICAVVCVHLRARGRDQTAQERLRRTAEPPGRPTREGEQSGGDPEYDDVVTAIDIEE